MKQKASVGAGGAAGEVPAAGTRRAAGKDTAPGRRRGGDRIRSEPADFGGPQAGAPEDQAERQGFDRQRLDPQDQPPADVLDRDNLAGEKDFELGPGGRG